MHTSIKKELIPCFQSPSIKRVFTRSFPLSKWIFIFFIWRQIYKNLEKASLTQRKFKMADNTATHHFDHLFSLFFRFHERKMQSQLEINSIRLEIGASALSCRQVKTLTLSVNISTSPKFMVKQERRQEGDVSKWTPKHDC